MSDKNKKSEPTPENTDANYNPTARDFQRTEEDVDNISGSEKEQEEKNDKNKRTHLGNTTPDKEKMG
jgi:hypothetical protein